VFVRAVYEVVVVKLIVVEGMGAVAICGYVVSNYVVAGGIVNSDAVEVFCDVVSDEVVV